MTLIATSVGRAQPYRLPESVQVEIEGERHQAFDLGGFSALLRMDSDLEFALRELELRNEQFELSLSVIDNLSESMELAIEQREILREDNQVLYDMWREENKKRHKAENRPRLGNPIAWTTSAVLAVLSAVLGVILAVRN